jgi:hypothetical protein
MDVGSRATHGAVAERRQGAKKAMFNSKETLINWTSVVPAKAGIQYLIDL